MAKVKTKKTAISFKLPTELREEIRPIISKYGLTMTGFVAHYAKRRVQAEKEAEARKQPDQERTEVVLLLDDRTRLPLLHEAAAKDVSIEELIYRLCLANAQQRATLPAPGYPGNYAEFPKLVDCVCRAYDQDCSPLDALLDLYLTLPPAKIPMTELFTAALAAVPIGPLINERIRQGLQLWYEQKMDEVKQQS